MKKTGRSMQPELLDLGPSYYSQQEYEDCLHQLDRVGRLLGGNRATFAAFDQLPKPDSILDVGCGGGQLTLELAKRFPNALVTGIDINAQAVAIAKKSNSLKNVTFHVPSSSELDYPPNSFDVVTTTLVCHHLNDDQLIDFLKRAFQIAKKTIIINDLHRHWLAYSSFALIAKPLFNNRLITHDGLISIKRAFKKKIGLTISRLQESLWKDAL